MTIRANKMDKELEAYIRNKLQAAKTALDLLKAGKEVPNDFIDKALKDLKKVEEMIPDAGRAKAMTPALTDIPVNVSPITPRFQNPKQEKLKQLLIQRNKLSNQLLIKHGLTKDKQVELQKAKVSISNEEIFEKIQSLSPYIKKQRITDLLNVNKEYLLIKGIVNFSYDDDIGDEYPYFGILLKSDGSLIVEVFKELLDVNLIDGKHYFVTYWQEPECGKRGLEIYVLEGQFLKMVFVDRSDAT